jgi:hypothetical protein
MSNVIEMLEKIGSNPGLRYADGDVLERAMAVAQIDPKMRAAVIAHDRPQLEAGLGATPNTCAIIYSVDD